MSERRQEVRFNGCFTRVELRACNVMDRTQSKGRRKPAVGWGGGLPGLLLQMPDEIVDVQTDVATKVDINSDIDAVGAQGDVIEVVPGIPDEPTRGRPPGVRFNKR
jgi:hypothetical protein